MEVTPEEAKTLASAAYIFTYPLVASYGEMYVEAIDSTSPSYSGGFGNWLHEWNAASCDSDMPGGLDVPCDIDMAAGIDMAASATTTLYSSAWVDVRSEPWLARPPAIDVDHFLTTSTSDLWGFSIDEMGPDSDARENVVVASATWQGDVPDVVDRVVRGDSAFVHLESCIGMRDPGGLDPVRRIQHDYLLEPLSAHVGRRAPAPAPPPQWVPFYTGAETGDEFWSLANFALSLTTPHPLDREILDRIAAIGVVAGRPWDASSLDRDVAEAIEDGRADALSRLMRSAAEALGPDLLRRSRFATDRDYISRALGALWRGSSERSTG